MFQTKEQDKATEEKLSEVKIGNLPEKEFRVVMGLHQTKSFCTVKETINKTKVYLLNGRRYMQMIFPIRGKYSKYTKNSCNSTS